MGLPPGIAGSLFQPAVRAGEPGGFMGELRGLWARQAGLWASCAGLQARRAGCRRVARVVDEFRGLWARRAGRQRPGRRGNPMAYAWLENPAGNCGKPVLAGGAARASSRNAAGRAPCRQKGRATAAARSHGRGMVHPDGFTAVRTAGFTIRPAKQRGGNAAPVGFQSVDALS